MSKIFWGICAAVAAFLFAHPQSSAAATLGENECQLISDYEITTDQSFSQQLTNMIHQREYCVHTNTNCDVELQKRMADFYVLFRGQEYFRDAEVGSPSPGTSQSNKALAA